MAKVCLDFDGLISDTFPMWDRYFNMWALKHNHTDLNHNDYETYPKVCSICFEHCLVSQDIQLLCPPITGAVEGTRMLSSEHKLFLVTHRKSELEAATHLWLQRYHLLNYFTEVIITTDNKRQICDQLEADFMVDDNPKVVSAFKESKTKAICFHTPFNRGIDVPIRVYDWDHLQKKIRRIYETTHRV